MGKSQRTKGAVYEREIAKQFSEAVNSYFARNIGQARDGGNDIDVGPLVVECKRRQTLTTLEGWMAQALNAANEKQARGDAVYFPAVVMRADAGESMILFRLEDFLALFKDELQRRCEEMDPPGQPSPKPPYRAMQRTFFPGELLPPEANADTERYHLGG